MNYNLSQLNAINAKEDAVIIKAPAGSGKTSTIVGAVEEYRKNHPTDKIVVITFTRKAAAELQERIKLMNVEISTIHSWSYRRLNQLGAEYNFSVDLLDEQVIKDALAALCKIRRQFYLNQFQLYSFIMGNYNIDIDEKIRRIFETIREDYIKWKKKNGFYDFTDLPQYLYDKLQDYDERIIDIDALFVDEFQDVDPTQLEIFNVVDAKKKVMVGDPRQAIYQFRGAVEEIFDKLDGFTEYFLDVNYRSYQEIIDYAVTINNLAKDIGDVEVVEFVEIEGYQPSEILCERGKGGRIYIINQLGMAHELVSDSFLSDKLVVKRLMADSQTQILCRSNRQVKKLQAQGIENVSTIHQAKGLEYKNVILVGFPIDDGEECNVAYVGMTRAKDTLCCIDFDILLCIICAEEITTTKKLF